MHAVAAPAIHVDAVVVAAAPVSPLPTELVQPPQFPFELTEPPPAVHPVHGAPPMPVVDEAVANSVAPMRLVQLAAISVDTPPL